MKVEKWKKLDSKYLVETPWVTLRVDTCALPNGNVKNDYYVLEYANWVNAVAITNDGKLLMIRQYRHSADIISLELPGGVIDDGEKPEQAIKRELLEETGYIFENCTQLAEVYPNPSTSTNKTFTFLLTGGTKIQNQQLDEDEFLNVELYSIKEVKSLLKANQIAQALHVAALYYGLEAIKEL